MSQPFRPANDNRPPRPPSPDRVRIQSLPVVGRIDAATGAVFYTAPPPPDLA